MSAFGNAANRFERPDMRREAVILGVAREVRNGSMLLKT